MRYAAVLVLASCLAAAPSSAAVPCDAGLALDDSDPLAGAAAIELCDVSVEGSAGVVMAEYVTIDGASELSQLPSGLLGIGLLDEYGPNVLPQRGQRMLALSSGAARSPSDPGYQSPTGFSKGYLSNHAPGLPYGIPACGGLTTGTANDSAALRLTLKVPDTAHSFSFRFKFHSYDYPMFVCSSFDDWFVALVSPAPPGADPASGNVAFDAAGDPITVNSPELLSVCAAGTAGGLDFPCLDGEAELAGTGYEGRAATPWLRTAVPVIPGDTITLTFGIWDSGDGALDTTALVDDFEWSTSLVEAPSTQPAPEPSGLPAGLAALAALGVLRHGRGSPDVRPRGDRARRLRPAREAARSPARP